MQNVWHRYRVNHSMCCVLAQRLHKVSIKQDRHDWSLRPIYHRLLEKYNFQESDNEKPWYQLRPPSAVMEYENTKILWDVPFQLQKAPENGANKIDMSVYKKTD